MDINYCECFSRKTKETTLFRQLEARVHHPRHGRVFVHHPRECHAWPEKMELMKQLFAQSPSDDLVRSI